MENKHRNELLAILCSEEKKITRGKLKIFFGILPGVGKTHAMLRVAQTGVVSGKRVAAGLMDCFEDAGEPETQELLKGIILIPSIKEEHNGILFDTFDLDAMTAAQPQLVVLACPIHVTPGNTYPIPYQKVQVLLDLGIDVYCTLNVSQLESCSGFVSQITGETELNTIPDDIFIMADVVEMVDIDPEKFIARISGSKKFTHSENILRKENIIQLQRLAHHMMMIRLDFRWQGFMRQWKPKQKMLVLIGTDAFSEFLIRRAYSLACLVDAELTALYMTNGIILSEKEKKQLADNIRLVEQLGAEVISYPGNDPAKDCLAICQRERISHIFTGKYYCGRPDKKFINQLINNSGNINVHVYGTESHPEKRRTLAGLITKLSSIPARYIVILLGATGAALVCIPLSHITGYVFLPFLLLVILLVMVVNLRMGVILLSTLLVGVWLQTIFTPSHFSFNINTISHSYLFIIFFMFALLNSILAIKFKEQETKVDTREQQTNALFLLSRKLGSATSVDEVVEASMHNIKECFSVENFFLFMDGKQVERKYIPPRLEFTENDMKIANWAYMNDKIAGQYTEAFPASKYTYYPLKGAKLKLGVVAMQLKNPCDTGTTVFWDAFKAQIALAVEHQYMGQLASKTSLLKESEKLYKTLFNSISHELRIPVATIMGASDILVAGQLPEHVKTVLCNEIIEASKRLNRLIENLLNMSRIESGRIAAHTDWCDIHDLFQSVLENLKEELNTHRVETSVPEAMPMVMLDFGLMERALHNMVYNACIYAPPGTTVGLNARFSNHRLVLQVTDMGPGFEPKDLPHVFEKFWRSKGSITGGLGLGLSIVKGFVEAHQGTVCANNRENGGACFTIEIPMDGVKTGVA